MLSDEQKKLRLTGIGGSEIAAVCGLNPYSSPIDVWRAKCEGFVPEVTGPMLRGTFLEDGVAKWWAHANEATLREVGTIRHPKEEIVICTPDRIATQVGRDEFDLSIKVPGPHVADQWGADGSDEAPDAALLQAQWELLPLGILYGIRRAVIAAPVHGELRSYQVEADADLQASLVDAAKRFWQDFVKTKRPPPPDASESYGEWLKVKHQNGSGPEVQASPELTRIVNELRLAKAQKKGLEEKERGLRNELLAAIGDASGVAGLCSYRLTKGKPTINWTEVCLEGGIPIDLVNKWTSRTPYRVLRLSKNGDENE